MRGGSLFDVAGSPVIQSISSDFRPKRIILVRHGESQGNVDDSAYVTTPDWRVGLTERGMQQASDAGVELRDMIGDAGQAFFYYSPYKRTTQTLERICDHLDDKQIIAVREEPRISELQFGNFQNVEEVLRCKEERHKFGRFYYRFKSGESGLDVYSRVSSFITTLVRDCHQYSQAGHDLSRMNVVIVTHGLALRLYLMRWFQFSVEIFEQSSNPDNCQLITMRKHTGKNGHKVGCWVCGAFLFLLSLVLHIERSVVSCISSLLLTFEFNLHIKWYELDASDRESLSLPECCGVPQNVHLHKLSRGATYDEPSF